MAEASQNQMLKAKFQIGSVHGRVSYKTEDRVFHQNDLPEKAVAPQMKLL